jgi:hypothetical protein
MGLHAASQQHLRTQPSRSYIGHVVMETEYFSCTYTAEHCIADSDGDTITGDGIMRLCEELGVEPADVVMVSGCFAASR